jgi:hypothetical protein
MNEVLEGNQRDENLANTPHRNKTLSERSATTRIHQGVVHPMCESRALDLVGPPYIDTAKSPAHPT